jgi:hypothetical protein
MQEQDGEFRIHTHSSIQQRIDLVGNYPSSWIWRHVESILSSQVFTRILPFHLSLRKLTFGWRFGIWAYLAATTEQLISANDFQDEQQLSFGQAYAVVLLIVPMEVLWCICYRAFPSFAQYLNSPRGRLSIQYAVGFLFGFASRAFVMVLAEERSFQTILSLSAIACILVPLIVREDFSEEVQRWLGTISHPSSPSFWAIWSADYEIQLPEIAHDEIAHDP